MSKKRFDLIVIGGGPAGVTATLRARELGASVALIERKRLGGTCTNDGCVPTRVLARAARLARDARQITDYGLVGAAPTVDLAAVMAQVQAKIELLHAKKDLLGTLDRSGVTTLSNAGPARFVDAGSVELGDGTRLTAEKFIICAGGYARRLPFPGAELAYTHGDIWELRALPRSLAIIGAAATGCQLASIFNAFGSQVTLLEVAPRILAGEDADVSGEVDRAFAANGIRVATSIERITELTRQGAGLRLAYERGYITTDDYLRTSQPHIYAAGDINGKMMLVQSGGYEARVAAENAVGGNRERVAHSIVPHGGFTDPEYGSVGPTEAEARKLGDVLVATAPMSVVDRAVIDGHPEGFCKLIVRRDNHTLVAAHVVGEQALEIVHVVAGGIAAGMRVEQLANLAIAYPTYTAVLGAAAQQLMRELGTVSTAQWRALGQLAVSPL